LISRCRDTGGLASAADSFRSAYGSPGSAINGLRGGMTTLVNALVADLDGVNVKSNRTVTAVRKSKTGWIVETADVSLRTDNVVLALSAPAARRVLRGQDRINAALEKFSVGDVAVVSLVVQSAKLDKAPVGSGVLVDPDQTSVRAKALTHASAKWEWVKETFGPGTHLIRLSYGRNGVIEESLDELQRLAETAGLQVAGRMAGIAEDRQRLRIARAERHRAPRAFDRTAAIAQRGKCKREVAVRERELRPQRGCLAQAGHGLGMPPGCVLGQAEVDQTAGIAAIEPHRSAQAADGLVEVAQQVLHDAQSLQQRRGRASVPAQRDRVAVPRNGGPVALDHLAGERGGRACELLDGGRVLAEAVDEGGGLSGRGMRGRMRGEDRGRAKRGRNDRSAVRSGEQHEWSVRRVRSITYRLYAPRGTRLTVIDV
jgi:hypothetical protein